MHIPSASTQTVELLDFETALASSGQNKDYDSSKWLYVPDFYTEYRYILGTKGDNPLICIGINPSTAAPDDLDNTLKSVARIAAANRYPCWMMFNVYAQRATRPDDMDREMNAALHAENMKAFDYILSSCSQAGYCPSVWAAWGTIIEKRSYLAPCLRDMFLLSQKYAANWFCAGNCSAKGHPHHPLYLKKDAPLAPFDIKKYINILGG